MCPLLKKESVLKIREISERFMLQHEKERNNNNNSIYLNTIKNSAKADVVVYGQ